MKRRADQKHNRSRLVALWIPGAMLDALDDAVKEEDTDRSKLIRRALRHHLLRLGVNVPTDS